MPTFFSLRITALVLALLGLPFEVIHAQTLRLPPKDVAVLVDVSVSVRKNRQAHDEQVKHIITSLVSGSPFDGGSGDWEVVTDGVSPEMKKVFSSYLGAGKSAEGSAELTPLATPGNNLLVLPLGKLTTVMSHVEPHRLSARPVTGTDFTSQLRANYPQEANDQSTCFWFAMAQAADTLKKTSPDGYYLFVVSDEEDDPDYRAEGPEGHSTTDYKAYRRDVMAEYPESYIRGTIEKYFKKKPYNSPRNAELYMPAADFAQTLIARFYQRGADRHASNKVAISWYAMNVKGQIVQSYAVPPVIEPVKQPDPLPPHFVTPAPTPSIQLLGEVEVPNKTRVFDYGMPLIVWQVVNGNQYDLKSAEVSCTADKDQASFTVKTGLRSAPLSKRTSGPKTVMLKDPDSPQQGALAPLEAGTYRIKIVQHLDKNKTLEKEFSIEIRPHWEGLLPLLALISGIVALGIFIYAWRSLREKPAAA